MLQSALKYSTKSNLTVAYTADIDIAHGNWRHINQIIALVKW